MLLIEPSLSTRIKSRKTYIPSDTMLILTEATRVLLESMSIMAGGTKICGLGNDIPYVVVSPLPRTDSFSVRVGQRATELCVNEETYVVVFGDTIPYLSRGWAENTFHRRQLKGLDTLWVKSCLGNPLTGVNWCQETWQVVGW